MPLYRDKHGAVHDDMGGSALPFMPEGVVKLTAAEEDAVLNPPLTLAKASADKISELENAYSAAIQLPVSYMGTTFQADDGSQGTLTKCLVAGAVPVDFYWLDATNTPVTMTFTQLQGLAGAMLTQGQSAFVTLQVRKTTVRAATTIAKVQAVVW